MARPRGPWQVVASSEVKLTQGMHTKVGSSIALHGGILRLA
jgi:hypothetical protein